MSRYTEAVCGDGAVILLDGVPLEINDVLSILNGYENQYQKEKLLIQNMLRKCDEESRVKNE